MSKEPERAAVSTMRLIQALQRRVTCSFGVADHARRDACEDVEAAAIRRIQIIQARSPASDPPL
jgi:hypothetical protein